MIYLKLRQAGLRVNHKRIERLYAVAHMQVRRRRPSPKKVPIAERQPLCRPTAANYVWSMDFMFDRDASGRTIKSLTVVYDATDEAAAIVAERNLGRDHLTRLPDQLCAFRGHPAVIRTDHGKAGMGKAMLTWTFRNNVALRPIEPGKPAQIAHQESFNGRFRDECLNDHWFTSLAHTRVVIEAWRSESNDDRPKCALGGLTPSAYARQLGATADTLALGSKPARYGINIKRTLQDPSLCGHPSHIQKAR